MEIVKISVIAFLSLVMIASAIFAVVSKKISLAIIASGIISLFASIIFLLLASPDVAMTEAAIGAGLTTFVFFIILRKIEKQHATK
ncbi:MAG: hydrogenase subunit MbhD domain-containing protein [Bacteroidales bacterium]|jgi:uncharacterized MnhB-related membrane protein